jgi:Winged helix DNA-binding domain
MSERPRGILSMSVAQRRARLVARHRLGGAADPAASGPGNSKPASPNPAGLGPADGDPADRNPADRNPAGDPVAVARALVALHSTDPATVFLSVAARAPIAPADLERALYAERSLVRMLGMRRTVFVVPTEFAPVVQQACGAAIAVNQRRLLLALLSEAEVADDPEAWLADVADSTVRALAARGEANAVTLCADEPRLRTQVTVSEGKSYGGPVNITSRVLFLLAAQGRIVRGRPAGSWLSTQYKWSTVDGWWPGGLPQWTVAAAQVELARRWLAAFGPGTVTDLKWWTGWTLAETRRALAGLDTVEVDLDGVPGLVLASDVDDVPAVPPRAVLLPALDPTVMGWAARDWYLGGHGPALFDRSGNAGPTVWWDGRIVGGWAQRTDGEVVVRLLEPVDLAARRAVKAAAAGVREWLGAVRVTPRFRTPLERELSGAS